MFFCPNVPASHLGDFSQNHMLMAFSHLITAPESSYTEFFYSLDKTHTHVILDSGAYEAHIDNLPLATYEETIMKAQWIGASEIQFLEVFWDGKATVDIVKSWISKIDATTRSKYKWQAIVQGQDANDFLYCFEEFCQLEEIDVIGIPKDIVTRCFQHLSGNDSLLVNRLYFLINNIQKAKKTIHLLGLDDPIEVIIQSKLSDKIRSIDSSLPFRHAIEGVKYSTDQVLYPENPQRFDDDLHYAGDIVALAKHNISTIKTWCQEPHKMR